MTLRPFSADLQKQFRDTLGTPGAPEVIDDGQPVVAVAVVAQVNTASSAGFTQVTDGTDTLAIGTDGGIIPSKNPFGTVLFAAASKTTTGSAVLATVTAGKTAHIVAAGLSITCPATTTDNTATLLLNGVVLLNCATANGAATSGAPNSISVTFPADARPTVAATQTITYSQPNSTTPVAAWVAYVEV